MNDDPSLCTDCGIDTTPCSGQRGCRHAGRWEWYMINNDLWHQAGSGDGFLCISCLELRLGRELTAEDLPALPVNFPTSWDTPRLAELKMAALTKRMSRELKLHK